MSGGVVLMPAEPTDAIIRAMSDALDPVIMGGFQHHAARLRVAYRAAVAVCVAEDIHRTITAPTSGNHGS